MSDALLNDVNRAERVDVQVGGWVVERKPDRGLSRDVEHGIDASGEDRG
jgi:hypothetical protein